MISRLKALSCLAPPPPLLSLTLSDPSPFVCKLARGRMVGQKGRQSLAVEGESQKRRNSCPAETSRGWFCLIDYLRKSGRKQRIILRKHLFSAAPLALSFASKVWSHRMMDEELALWPPLSSPLPPSLSSSSFPFRHTHTQTYMQC